MQTKPLYALAKSALLMLAITLAGCGVSTRQQEAVSPRAQQGSYTPVIIRGEVGSIGLVKPEDMCGEMLVADVVVGTPLATRWNTPDGTVSLDAARQGPEEVVWQGYLIYKVVQFTKMTLLVDHRPAPTKQFVTLGGQVGQDRYMIGGEPQLTPGQHYVVVFDPPSTIPHPFVGGTMLLAYAYPVDAQGMVHFLDAPGPGDKGTGPYTPPIVLTLDSLKQILAACK